MHRKAATVVPDIWWGQLGFIDKVVWTCSHLGEKSRSIQGARFDLEWLMTGPTATAPEALSKWSGKGDHRILVRVEPVDLEGRDCDESVAHCDLDFARLLPEGGQVDLSMLQVHMYILAYFRHR
ncbi:MAG: hypothetical protein JSV03_09330 [Planctomycetota bacterium]|nr:MAG: hypothetical protein JSV03_09330 [Planctomycetota bacterium]